MKAVVQSQKEYVDVAADDKPALTALRASIDGQLKDAALASVWRDDLPKHAARLRELLKQVDDLIAAA